MCTFYAVKVCMEQLRYIRFFPTKTKRLIAGFNLESHTLLELAQTTPEPPTRGDRGKRALKGSEMARLVVKGFIC